MRHQYFDSTVEDNEESFQYFWLHLSEPDLAKQLDYQRTVFYRTEWTFRKKRIQLLSFNHYQEF